MEGYLLTIALLLLIISVQFTVLIGFLFSLGSTIARIMIILESKLDNNIL